MADVQISCFLVLCVAICVGAKTMSGKAYYCRDPDTGKLHDVNTTWPSTTFCGSYICKIRKKNHTNTEVQPLRQLNITNRDNKFILTFNSTIENVSQAYPSESRRVSNINTNISKESKEIQNLVREKMANLNEHIRQGDRYLTEDEVKAFTEVLRSMKKSDLDALLELYSLAQDIYKDIDKATDENIIEETLRDLKEDNMSEKISKAINKSTSYWYEPLAVISNKHRLNENDLSKDSELMQNVLDNLTHGRNNVVSMVKPKETTVRTPLVLTPKPRNEPNPSMFFKGTLTEDDFGKLPYFYPMSSFQRLSSYINPYLQNSIQSQQKAYSNVQMPPTMIQMIPPWYKPYMVPYPPKPQPDITYNKRVTEAKTTAQTQILANPMQNNQKNLTETENSYFNAYPWSLYNLYPPIRKVPQQLPYVNTGYLNYYPNAVLINPDITDHKQDVEVNAMVNAPEKKIPDWQTEPLPNSVLDEVRANIIMKSKLIPLRKKMRLERVGKVIKLEDIKKDRTKREADDFDEYEAYVEKYTCGSDTEPGFFRMGNITEPYPACCPQRIGKGS